MHIPFGYKLKDDELEFINALQFGHDTLDRYRVRHAYVDVLRNVFFRRTSEGDVVVREKNLELCDLSPELEIENGKYIFECEVI